MARRVLPGSGERDLLTVRVGTGETLLRGLRRAETGRIRRLQRKLYMAAKRDRGRRFHALYDRLRRGDVLREAWSDTVTRQRACCIVNTIGKPCAGKPHARFERGRVETGLRLRVALQPAVGAMPLDLVVLNDVPPGLAAADVAPFLRHAAALKREAIRR